MKTITNYLEKVIIGQILSDGYVERTGVNCRLSFSFGGAYLEYANWIGIQDYCSNSVYSVVSVTKEKKYTNYRLKTRTNSIFNKYREMFYIMQNNGKYRKAINIGDLPIVLAHLIMGDGTFSTRDNRVRICTYSFSFEECTMLADAIKKKCAISCKVLLDRADSSGEKQYILTIGKNSLMKLQEVVLPHMHKSMLYRIGLTFLFYRIVLL